MSVKIAGIEKGSYAERLGIKSGDTLISIEDNEIMDVLDYRFYQSSDKVRIKVMSSDSTVREYLIEKEEYEEIGLEFGTYLMDEKRRCKNNCIFCFIDQLPKGLRESLYFKDDDSRLSFLFGNYITLTNITRHEIDRIIKMHISPINISVHTTNPELRVKMMRNKNAGKALDIIKEFNDAGINMNCQLVLCPGYNDGAELERTLKDLSELEYVKCVAAVPVGLTKYRQGLAELKSFDKESAKSVIDTINKYADICFGRYKERRIYPADEFYLLSEEQIPDAAFYGDFPQLENGVGLTALLKSEVLEFLEEIDGSEYKRTLSIATGMAAYPLICEIVELCMQKNKGLNVKVFGIKNEFFGEKITVSGLVTATDIINQLKDKDLGDELLIPASMLRSERDMFLDSITVEELSNTLNIAVTCVENDGYDLVENILGIEE